MDTTAILTAPLRNEPGLNEVLAIDIPRAAKVLNLSEKTVRRHLKKGVLPFVRIGGRIRIPLEGLKKVLSGEMVK